MAAFDWSPGGCCCGLPWFFDIQGSEFDQSVNNSGRLVRSCSVYPAKTFTTSPNFTTAQVGPWVIDSGVPVGSIAGYNADGNTTWGIGRRTDIANAGQQQLIGFDVRTQTKLCDAPLTFPISGFGGGDAIMPGPDGMFVNLSSSGNFNPLTLTTIDRTGAITSTNAGTVTYFLPDGGTESVAQLAFLDWPNAIVLATKSPNAFGVPSQDWYWRLTKCELSAAGGVLNVNNRVVLREITYDLASMRANGTPGLRLPSGYDHFDGHYAAVFWYDYTPNGHGGYHQKAELVIDGQNIKTLIDPTVGAGTYFSTYQTGTPHCCYPHETLGGGYVAVMHRADDSPINNQTSPAYELHVYKGGSLVWKTNSGQRLSSIFGSTDRWIYFGGSNVSEPVFNTMTSGKHRVPSIPGIDPASRSTFWMARHDGSEVLPWNLALSDTFNTFVDFNGKVPVVGPFVRDSTSVPNSMPATYQEMYDHRHDV